MAKVSEDQFIFIKKSAKLDIGTQKRVTKKAIRMQRERAGLSESPIKGFDN